jgi:hypothetical protein
MTLSKRQWEIACAAVRRKLPRSAGHVDTSELAGVIAHDAALKRRVITLAHYESRARAAGLWDAVKVVFPDPMATRTLPKRQWGIVCSAIRRRLSPLEGNDCSELAATAPPRSLRVPDVSSSSLTNKTILEPEQAVSFVVGY